MQRKRDREVRRVKGLVRAAKCEPLFVKQYVRKGLPAKGISYERQLASFLPHATHGQWFEYHDFNGRGYCQTDMYFRSHGSLFILEAKLSDVEHARDQLDYLYLPVVGEALRARPLGIIVTRYVTKVPSHMKVCFTLEEAMSLASRKHFPIWHWRGPPINLNTPVSPFLGPGASRPASRSLPSARESQRREVA